MNLEELITALEATDPNRIVARGFSNPHSYRGDYMDLAFEPATDIRVGEMLDAARSALGATFQGWKGGEFTMSEHTWCWLSQEGDASGETISALLVDLLLAPAAVSVVPPATNQTALRRQFGEVLRRWGLLDEQIDQKAAEEFAVTDLLAVLPAPAERAAVLREAADDVVAYCPDHGDRETARIACHCEIADELRRLADEAPHTETPDAEPAAPETVHACPPDGSGLTPCCGRTPFELPRTDRISSEPAAVTCAPAVVAQPGKEA